MLPGLMQTKPDSFYWNPDNSEVVATGKIAKKLRPRDHDPNNIIVKPDFDRISVPRFEVNIDSSIEIIESMEKG